jgi:hypothetical protein
MTLRGTKIGAYYGFLRPKDVIPKLGSCFWPSKGSRADLPTTTFGMGSG